MAFLHVEGKLAPPKASLDGALLHRTVGTSAGDDWIVEYELAFGE
jgi:hypothetical protein